MTQSLASALDVLGPTMTAWAILDATPAERAAWDVLLAWRKLLNPSPSDILDRLVAGGRYG